MNTYGQQHTRYPQLKETLTPFRLPIPKAENIEYVYPQREKTPMAIKVTFNNGLKALWIDDDQDMTATDFEGDQDNDCLLIDLNNDGKYGDSGDLIVDYIDANNDGKADYQVIIENSTKDYTGKWKSHYMWFVDNDQNCLAGLHIGADTDQFSRALHHVFQIHLSGVCHYASEKTGETDC